MRVSNEQAKNDIAKYCYHLETKQRVSPLVNKNYEYASDLLEVREIIKEIREDLLNCFDLMNHAVNEDYWEPEQQVLWIKLQNDVPELLKEIERV